MLSAYLATVEELRLCRGREVRPALALLPARVHRTALCALGPSRTPRFPKGLMTESMTTTPAWEACPDQSPPEHSILARDVQSGML